jgi:hypothetical protein
MAASSSHLQTAIATTVQDYRSHDNPAVLQARLRDAIEQTTPDALVAAAEPFRDIPVVAATLYERVIQLDPANARALVILANAYWLLGRGPDLVEELASRAIAADPSNRGAWHLWALSEGDPRQRLARWQQVTARFPADALAHAAVADNAASLAGAEQDADALALAIASYEHLLATAETDAQRTAVEGALSALRGWRL